MLDKKELKKFLDGLYTIPKFVKYSKEVNTFGVSNCQLYNFYNARKFDDDIVEFRGFVFKFWDVGGKKFIELIRYED